MNKSHFLTSAICPLSRHHRRSSPLITDGGRRECGTSVRRHACLSLANVRRVTSENSVTVHPGDPSLNRYARNNKYVIGGAMLTV